MKLITFNTWQGRLARNFIPFLKEQAADILCLQELNSSQHAVGDWLDTFRCLEAIQEATTLEYRYYSPTYSYDIMDVEVGFGNGILSRYAMSDQQTIFTYGSYTKITKPSEHIHNTRNAQIVKLQTEEGSLTLVNIHAHWEKEPMGSELSVQRLEIVAEALKDIQGPIIVAGDFNLASESEAIQLFKKSLHLKDLTAEHNISNTLNNLVTPYKTSPDHILIDDQINVKDFQLQETLLSDHKALVLEFDITN